MYPARFEYHAPQSVDEALTVLERYGDEGKVLAGGQSLIPLMKLRFASPKALVDINRIEGLDTIQEDNGFLSIGALVRHKDCERSDALKGRFGVLGDAAPQISDPIVRNLGTVVGSLAHADPQGDWGSALMAAGAQLEVVSSGGSRTIPLDELFQGPFMTGLEPNEIATAVRVPDPGPERRRDVPQARAQGRRLCHRWRCRPSLVRQRHRRPRGDRADRGRPTEPAGRGRRGGARRRRAERRHDQGGGGARRRGRAAAERRARERRLQAERRPRLHGARAPEGRRDGAGRPRGGEMTEAAVETGAFTRTVTATVNGTARSADVETRLLLVHFLRETLGADRHAHRLRHVELRRVHGAPGRDAREVVHRPRRAGRRAARSRRSRASPAPTG